MFHLTAKNPSDAFRRLDAPTHCITVNGARLVLAELPIAGSSPKFQGTPSARSCSCGDDAGDMMWDAGEFAFVCECGARYEVLSLRDEFRGCYLHEHKAYRRSEGTMVRPVTPAEELALFAPTHGQLDREEWFKHQRPVAMRAAEDARHDIASSLARKAATVRKDRS